MSVEPGMVENPFGLLRSECASALREALSSLGLEPPRTDVEEELSIPPKLEFGDLSTSLCFELAKNLGVSPNELAEEIAIKAGEVAERSELLKGVEAKGGYVNFWADIARLAELAVGSARSLGERYGFLRTEKPLRVVVEHTSANPIHPIHIGHGRNAILGDAIARLLRARGHYVRTHFYVNDAGRQVAILAYGYDKLGRPEPDEKPDHFFGFIYAATSCILAIRELKARLRMAEEAGDDDLVREIKGSLDSWAFSAFELKSKRPELFEKLLSAIEEDEDPETSISEIVRAYEEREGWAVQLIRGLCEKCLSGFRQTLSRLGIRFDRWDWESDVLWSGLVADVLARLDVSGFVRRRAGALELDAEGVVRALGLREELSIPEGFEIPPLTLTRSDGTTLYEIRDVAYTLTKFRDADIVINVIGADQKLAQLHVKLALCALGEHEKAKRLLHFAYNLVRIPGMKMSARRGRFISLDSLLDEAVARAYEEVPEHSPGLNEAERQAIAEAVGVGAVKFALISVDPDKEVVFTWDRVLNFEANSAPYLQYTHARACSILRKAGRAPEEPDFTLLTHGLERELILAVARLPEVVAKAADDLRPDMLASFAIYFADRFNSFYASLPVIRAQPRGLSDARLALVDAVRVVLRNALAIMGIEAPERM